MFTFGAGDLARLRGHAAVDTVGCMADGGLIQLPSRIIQRRTASERVKFRPFTRDSGPLRRSDDCLQHLSNSLTLT